jgi:hypothetical protein
MRSCVNVHACVNACISDFVRTRVCMYVSVRACVLELIRVHAPLLMQ